MGQIVPSMDKEINGCKLTSPNALRQIYADKKPRNEQIKAANDVIAVNLMLVTVPKPDLLSVDECKEAVATYLQAVAERDARPTISGMCLALGLSRPKFLEACETGNVLYRKTMQPITLPADVYEFFIALKDNYVAMIEGFMETGLIHPACGIFLLKNNGEYKEVVERRYSVTQTVVDVNQLAEKYNIEADAD